MRSSAGVSVVRAYETYAADVKPGISQPSSPNLRCARLTPRPSAGCWAGAGRAGMAAGNHVLQPGPGNSRPVRNAEWARSPFLHRSRPSLSRIEAGALSQEFYAVDMFRQARCRAPSAPARAKCSCQVFTTSVTLQPLRPPPPRASSRMPGTETHRIVERRVPALRAANKFLISPCPDWSAERRRPAPAAPAVLLRAYDQQSVILLVVVGIVHRDVEDHAPEGSRASRWLMSSSAMPTRRSIRASSGYPIRARGLTPWRRAGCSRRCCVFAFPGGGRNDGQRWRSLRRDE